MVKKKVCGENNTSLGRVVLEGLNVGEERVRDKGRKSETQRNRN